MIESSEKKGQDGGRMQAGGRMIETLVDLVRNTYTDELSAKENYGLVRLEQTWERRRSPDRVSVWRRAPVLATPHDHD